MRRTHIGPALLASLLAALAGCAAYVNIPPQPGDTAIHRPDMIPIPELMTNAVMWATARYPVEPPYAVNLPADTPRITYNNVVSRGTRDRGLPMTPKVENLPTYHVAEVRIRGTRAQVDVVLPRGLEAAATTVTFRFTMGTWTMQDARSWIAGVIPVPAPQYIPGSVEKPAPPQTAEEGIAETQMEASPAPAAEAADEAPADTPAAQLADWSEAEQEPAEPQPQPILIEQDEAPAQTEPIEPAPAQPLTVDSATDAIDIVLHPDGTLSREGEDVDLPTAFAGIGKESAVHLTIERGPDGSEASTAEAVIASFRIRGVEKLTVERVPAAPPEK